MRSFRGGRGVRSAFSSRCADLLRGRLPGHAASRIACRAHATGSRSQGSTQASLPAVRRMLRRCPTTSSPAMASVQAASARAASLAASQCQAAAADSAFRFRASRIAGSSQIRPRRRHAPNPQQALLNPGCRLLGDPHRTSALDAAARTGRRRFARRWASTLSESIRTPRLPTLISVISPDLPGA